MATWSAPVALPGAMTCAVVAMVGPCTPSRCSRCRTCIAFDLATPIEIFGRVRLPGRAARIPTRGCGTAPLVDAGPMRIGVDAGLDELAGRTRCVVPGRNDPTPTGPPAVPRRPACGVARPERGSPRSASAPSPSPRRACSTAGGHHALVGHRAVGRASHPAVRGRAGGALHRQRPDPDLGGRRRPASTCACTWSGATTASRSPRDAPGWRSHRCTARRPGPVHPAQSADLATATLEPGARLDRGQRPRGTHPRRDIAAAGRHEHAELTGIFTPRPGRARSNGSPACGSGTLRSCWKSPTRAWKPFPGGSGSPARTRSERSSAGWPVSARAPTGPISATEPDHRDAACSPAQERWNAAR